MGERCKHGIDTTRYCNACNAAKWQKAHAAHVREQVRAKRAAARAEHEQAQALLPPCPHGRTGFCKACWTAHKRASDPAYYEREKAAQRARSTPKPRSVQHLMHNTHLEPWELLLARIIGQAAKDYCDEDVADEDRHSAAVFFWHAGVRGRRIRQAAYTYEEAQATEDGRRVKDAAA